MERSYRANTRHALARRDDEPLALPPERRPNPDPADTRGGTLDILQAFAAQREETDRAFAALAARELERPSQWSSYQIDVRFRLHRFASHLVEHTGQIEKTLAALGAEVTDARNVVRRIAAARGAHERRSSRGVLDALDAALLVKCDAIGA